MKIDSVVARILLNDDPHKIQIVVRKTVLGDDGRVAAVYGLSSRNGEWIKKPEGRRYPDECLLPVSIVGEDVL